MLESLAYAVARGIARAFFEVQFEYLRKRGEWEAGRYEQTDEDREFVDAFQRDIAVERVRGESAGTAGPQPPAPPAAR